MRLGDGCELARKIIHCEYLCPGFIVIGNIATGDVAQKRKNNTRKRVAGSSPCDPTPLAEISNCAPYLPAYVLIDQAILLCY